MQRKDDFYNIKALLRERERERVNNSWEIFGSQSAVLAVLF